MGESQHTPIKPGDGDALVLIDLQQDFLPGGSIPVPAGPEVLTRANAYIERFHRLGLKVFATRCWHPPGHVSFLDRGGPWPVHCVAGTPGAEFPEPLRLPPDTVIISKGQLADRDAYSGFDGTDFAEILRSAGIGRLFVAGLTAEFCVLRSVCDALSLGFTVFVLADGVGAVDSLGGEQALASMAAQGARLIRGGDLLD